MGRKRQVGEPILARCTRIVHFGDRLLKDGDRVLVDLEYDPGFALLRGTAWVEVDEEPTPEELLEAKRRYGLA